MGRAIAHLKADSNHLKTSGRVQIVAERAKEYGVADKTGKRLGSLQSLRFLIGSSIPKLQEYDRFIADIKIPWLALLWKLLRSPQI